MDHTHFEKLFSPEKIRKIEKDILKKENQRVYQPLESQNNVNDRVKLKGKNKYKKRKKRQINFDEKNYSLKTSSSELIESSDVPLKNHSTND